ncbi:MAG: cryptochrome/photolyase family protein [Bosea sp. (in: a-proteobacteria)]
MTTLRFILGDQLTRGISSLNGLNPARDVVLMVEVMEEATYVRHHRQKIAFILSAMRHFALELRAEGITVDYVRLDDPANTGSFSGELQRAIARHNPDQVIITEPGEWRVAEMLADWREELPIALHIRDDTRFICSRAEFGAWADGRKSYRMEFFYREMRRKTGLLMEGDQPAGGQWNFDAENRKRLPAGVKPPVRQRFQPDATTHDVIAMVGSRCADHFGDLEPFGWAVTRGDALAALDHFIAHCLDGFGDYQDAMKQGEPFLFHALLSPYINIGLLDPLECAQAAEAAYDKGRASLNAVEGFIRQIIGWREYVRGIYWHMMPAYAETNALEASRPLPALYWGAPTSMNCMAQCVADTKRSAYAHHIQRLMVLGNFALLAGIKPAEIEEWFLIVYADAYEWVELPNVHGMVLFADGGVLGSKPYAASGAYIDRMSDYCAGCRHDPKLKSGPDACPFNPLYWDFLIRNEKQLAKNPRMAMPYRTLEKMTPERRAEIAREASVFLDGLA